MRTCGDCIVCCVYFEVPELEKKAMAHCPHLILEGPVPLGREHGDREDNQVPVGDLSLPTGPGGAEMAGGAQTASAGGANAGLWPGAPLAAAGGSVAQGGLG